MPETAVVEEAKQLRQEYITLKANYDTIAQNLSASSQELIAQGQALEVTSRELVEYQLRLRMAEDNLGSSKKALSAAEEKIVALRSDYEFVLQEKANLEGQVKQLQSMVVTT